MARLRERIPSHDLKLYFAHSQALLLLEQFLNAIPGQAQDDIDQADLARAKLDALVEDVENGIYPES